MRASSLLLFLAFLVGCQAEVGHDHEAKGTDDIDLVTVMRGLEGNVQALEAGLWRDDLPAVAEGAHGIAAHPHVGPSDLGRIKGALGDDFAGFIKADRATHDAAVAIAQAAKVDDKQSVVRGLATLQASCVSCHDGFRERLRAR